MEVICPAVRTKWIIVEALLLKTKNLSLVHAFFQIIMLETQTLSFNLRIYVLADMLYSVSR